MDPGNTRRWDRCVGDGSDSYGASVKCRLACWASMIIRWDPSGLDPKVVHGGDELGILRGTA